MSTKDSDAAWAAYEQERFEFKLASLEEKSFTDLDKDEVSEAYRMMIFPTWGNAFAVRVEKRKGNYSLTSKRTDGEAGFRMGSVVEAKTIELTPTESEELLRHFASARMFDLPEDDDVMGLDGDSAVFEAFSDGKYHKIERWCATSHESEKRGLIEFNALCKFLIGKSQLMERPSNGKHQLL